MTVSDDLFQIIKSLTKAEKIYFKKFASLFKDKNSSNYLRLFNEIGKQALAGDVYDEEKIKKGNYSGKFLKNISYHKNYLYNMIMTSLSVFKKDNKDSIPLRNLLSQSEILFDKLLYSQSLKMLLRAKKKAIDSENYFYLPEILNKERIMSKYSQSNEEISKMRVKNFGEIYNSIGVLKNSIDYYNLHDYMSNNTGKTGTGFSRNEKEHSELEKFFANPLLKDVSNAKTFFSKTIFNNLNLHYCIIKNDFEQAYIIAKRNVELWEKNLDKAGGNFDNYTVALNNLLTSEIRTKRFNDCELTAAKMKELPIKYPKYISEKNRVFIFYSTSVLMISKYNESLEVEEIRRHYDEVMKYIHLYENKIEVKKKIILYFFLAMSNFMLEDYQKCVYWTGKIINLYKTEFSEDYQCYARLIHLISYFELGFFDSLEYALKSTYHFMSKRNRVYKYEDIILKYLRNSFKIKTNAELIDMFSEMKNEMEKIYNDDFEKNAFDAFNIFIWLESKVEKIPFIEILKRQRTENAI